MRGNQLFKLFKERSLGSLSLRLLWWGTIAGLFTAFNITQSLSQGKLSLPPVYDDVSYLLQGATWLNAWRSEGFGGLLAAPIAHSPVMVWVAFLGFLLFGFQVWAAYAVNSIFIFGLLVGLDSFGQTLPLYQRLLLPLTVLTYPFVANLIMEFRPDLICNITLAFYIAIALRMDWRSPWDRNQWKQHLGLSSLLAFALLAKPSIFPITLFLATVTLFCAIVAHDNRIKK